MSETLGIPRRVSVKGPEGVDATVAITTYRRHVWMSIVPAFTWQAIMEPATVNELIQLLKLARDEVTRPTVASQLGPARKAIGRDHRS